LIQAAILKKLAKSGCQQEFSQISMGIHTDRGNQVFE